MKNKSTYIGAAFLMATSAIGPGFLTSTVVFTNKLMTSFGFAILISIIVDIIAQLNIWNIIISAGKPAQTIANNLLPGLGTFLSFMIITGGLVFNIGNVAGCGLGLNVLLGVPVWLGALISGLIAIVLFLVKDAGKAMDTFAKVLGMIMIMLMIYVASFSHPPITQAIHKTFIPDNIDFIAIVTIVGGTVGGYITFSGAHRLLEAGISGQAEIANTTKSAITGIAAASGMRILLFLATLGVVSVGSKIDLSNPAASVFELAAGRIGYFLFGLVIWAAAITSVVGASFTSISFAKTKTKHKNYYIIGFIGLATVLFLLFGKPIKVLIFAGAFNGFILALALGIMILTVILNKNRLRPKKFLLVSGIIVAIILGIMGCLAMVSELKKVFE